MSPNDIGPICNASDGLPAWSVSLPQCFEDTASREEAEQEALARNDFYSEMEGVCYYSLNDRILAELAWNKRHERFQSRAPRISSASVVPFIGCSKRGGRGRTSGAGRFNISISEAMRSLLRRSDYVFVGEDHAVNDEPAFFPLMREFYQAGVRYLAVEVNVDEQGAMDYFSETADVSRFTDHSQFMSKPTVKNLFLAAVHNGIRVVCVDEPTYQRDTNQQREQFIGEQLSQLHSEPIHEDMKVLVWMGAVHATKDVVPYATARSLLEQLGYRISGVKLESQSTIDFEHQAPVNYRRYGFDTTATAFSIYFPSHPPRSSFAYPAERIALQFPELRPIGPWRSHQYEKRLLYYKDAFDFVIFLSRNDHGDSGLSPF